MYLTNTIICIIVGLVVFLGHGPKFSRMSYLWHKGVLITLLTSLIPVPIAMYNVMQNRNYYEFNLLSLAITIFISVMISVFISNIETK